MMITKDVDGEPCMERSRLAQRMIQIFFGPVVWWGLAIRRRNVVTCKWECQMVVVLCCPLLHKHTFVTEGGDVSKWPQATKSKRLFNQGTYAVVHNLNCLRHSVRAWTPDEVICLPKFMTPLSTWTQQNKKKTTLPPADAPFH